MSTSFKENIFSRFVFVKNITILLFSVVKRCDRTRFVYKSPFTLIFSSGDVWPEFCCIGQSMLSCCCWWKMLTACFFWKCCMRANASVKCWLQLPHVSTTSADGISSALFWEVPELHLHVNRSLQYLVLCFKSSGKEWNISRQFPQIKMSAWFAGASREKHRTPLGFLAGTVVGGRLDIPVRGGVPAAGARWVVITRWRLMGGEGARSSAEAVGGSTAAVVYAPPAATAAYKAAKSG